MHSWTNRTLSALLVFGLIVLPASAAPLATPLGVVIAASQARVGASMAMNGSTIFQGDRLITAETGQLQVRFGNTQARFMPGSLAEVNQTPSGVTATLLSGSVNMASAAGDTFSLSANRAIVRPASSQAVLAQVTRVSPNELLLTSTRGALDVTFDGEVTTIPAGSSYRMLLDPSAADPQGQVGARPAGSFVSKKALFILIGVAGAAAGIALGVSSSSSTPVSPAAP
jgi:hypothetical protein